MPFGLAPETVARIQGVLAACPHVEQAILYGSRAMGTYREGSDIDLCLVGEAVTLVEQLGLESELDDLLLPYKIDVSRLHTLDNAALIEHIRRVGVELYSGKN